MITLCKSCRRPILWCVTEAEKRMPIDPDPVDDGNVIKTGATAEDPYNPGGRRLDVVRVMTKAEIRRIDQPELGDDFEPPAHRYNTHFSTCPHAERHRKRR